MLIAVANLCTDFESTFAPEIAAFTPPQPVRSPNLTSSPTWPRSPPSTVPTPTLQQQPLSGAKPNGVAAGEEVSVVQPVQLRHSRGARLSFLGGRKKDQAAQQQQQQHPPPPPIPETNGDHHVNGDAESATSGHSRGKDNPNRLSFFRGNGSTQPPVETKQFESPSMAGKHNERVVEHALPVGKGATAPGGRRKSSDLSRTPSSKENSDPNAAGGERKVGNVRKRLSMLKLGKKSSKGSGLMGSLDEE